MKVVFLNSVSYGSTGRIARGVASQLNLRGGESLFLFARGEQPNEVQAERIEGRAAVYAHVLQARLFDRQGFGSRNATRRLIDRIRSFDPDVIHLNNTHGYWLDHAGLFDYLAKANKPVVWTLHDCWPFTGHCAYFDMAACARWKTGCGDCPQRRAYPQSWLLDRSAQNYVDKRRLFGAVPKLTIATPSRWLAGLVSHSFLSEKKTAVMPNGIDLGTFHPVENDLRTQYGLTGKRLLLGVTNIWEPRKGLQSFFELRKRLDASYAMVLIGLSEQQLRDLPEGIMGFSRTADAHSLAAWYTAADVLVDCTREENFPTTHLEALACGTPVVTYTAGGSAEMLTPDCGIGVPVGDMDALIAAIPQALELDRAACIAQARQYDANDRLAAYLPLYDALAGETANRRMGE